MKSGDINKLLEDRDRALVMRSARRPLIAAYRVAHEGVSTGPVSGLGRAAKQWGSSRVNELAEKLRGAPVYVGHYTGSGPRGAVGYVLRAKIIDSPKGAEAVAVVAIEDTRAVENVKDGMLDTASVEADLVLEPDDKNWTVSSVEAVTGLALASSREHAPGFARARLLACTHELDSTDEGDTPAVEQTHRSAPAEFSESVADDPCVRPKVDQVATEAMENLNLTDAERRFVMKRVVERIPQEAASPESVRDEVSLATGALDEAKRLYRRPPSRTPVPFERRRGPVSYTDPEYNDLIPRMKKMQGQV